MALRPLNDRLLVQRAKQERTSKGGIIIPDTVNEKPAEAIVVSVGPGRRDKSGALVPLSVASGDSVLFSKYAGTDVKLNGEDYLILREDEVLAVIEA